MFSCRVCGGVYSQSRQPVSLQCGHSYCRLCLLIHQERSRGLRCCICNCKHLGLPIEDLPVNYDLLQACCHTDVSPPASSPGVCIFSSSTIMCLTLITLAASYFLIALQDIFVDRTLLILGGSKLCT